MLKKTCGIILYRGDAPSGFLLGVLVGAKQASGQGGLVPVQQSVASEHPMPCKNNKIPRHDGPSGRDITRKV